MRLTKINKATIIHFLEQYLINKFGVPSTLVFDNATYFSSLKLIEFYLDKEIILQYSSNYHPQGSGVAKPTNKTLICILKKNVVDH